jgi:prepilin-type N-terminal cleavage/methylation domain-containing protein
MIDRLTNATAQPLNRPTAGFTLIELLVALTLTGLVVLLSHAVMAQVSDAAARGGAVVADLDRHGNRRAWLVRAFANVTAGSGPMRGFEGREGWAGGDEREADRVAFYSHVPADTGDAERRVRLWLTGDSLLAETIHPALGGPADTLVMADGLRGFGAEFLMEYGANASWVREWVSPVSAPIAVRIRLQYADRTDTLLLHVGPRG